MVSIRGRYEYEDDGLTPGKKKEGGLHQNLFDEAGKLKGSARFIPDSDDEPDSYLEPVFVHVYDESRERSKEQDELAEVVAMVLSLLISKGVEKATPYASRFWSEQVQPALWSSMNQVANAVPFWRRSGTGREPVAVEATVVETPQELATVAEDPGVGMSASEAQARYLAAMVARQFSDDQMRLIASADIRDDERFLELKRVLSELPPEQVAQMLQTLGEPTTVAAFVGRGVSASPNVLDRPSDRTTR